MKSLHIFLCLVIASFCILSCNKDSQESTIDNSDVTQSKIVASIFGVVIDQNDRPVENALVSFDNNTTLTDIDGVYIFNDVSIGNRHNSLKIEKEGFFDGARTFRSTSSATQYQVTKLLTKAFDKTFDTTAGGSFTVANQTVHFSPNSIAHDSDGSMYQGTVQVAIRPIAADADERGLVMPGDLSALNAEGGINTLESFGMINVELRSPNGDRLQIASGKKATLSIELTVEQQEIAPQTIDLWSFDYERGLWIQEGIATLEDNHYKGEVSHFSLWGYYSSLSSVIVEGRLLFEQTVASHLYLSILNSNGGGGQGWTDANGYFSGRVPKDQELTLRIKYFWCSESVLYETKIGPFSKDVNLGEFMINLQELDLISINGTAVNCVNDPVLDGRIRLYDRGIYPFENGEFAILKPSCFPGTRDLAIIDVTDLQQIVIRGVDLAEEVDLGEVIVCDQTFDFIRVDGFDEGSVFILDSLTMNVMMDDNNTNIRCSLGGQLSEGSFYTVVNLSFLVDDASLNEQLELKTYDLEPSNIRRNNTAMQLVQTFDSNDGQLTINSIIPINNMSELVTGSYVFEGEERSSGLNISLTGNFEITRYF